MDLIEEYKKFLENGKTERECVSLIIQLAEKNGYKDVQKNDFLKPGEKVYVCKRNKSIALFEIGTGSIENGMNILGAHIDSPRLDVKQNPLYEDSGMCFLKTHFHCQSLHLVHQQVAYNLCIAFKDLFDFIDVS